MLWPGAWRGDRFPLTFFYAQARTCQALARNAETAAMNQRRLLEIKQMAAARNNKPFRAGNGFRNQLRALLHVGEVGGAPDHQGWNRNAMQIAEGWLAWHFSGERLVAQGNRVHVQEQVADGGSDAARGARRAIQPELRLNRIHPAIVGGGFCRVQVMP